MAILRNIDILQYNTYQVIHYKEASPDDDLKKNKTLLANHKPLASNSIFFYDDKYG